MPALGLTWGEALAVVLSTVGIYLALLVLQRLAGQRALATMSSFDFAAAVALGAIVGRVVLGATPNLLAGALGLTTLFAVQALFGLLRRRPALQALLNNSPVLLMADGRLLPDNLRRARVVEDEVREKLRQSGVHRYEQVRCLVLERTGAISLLRVGEDIDPDLLADVEGGSRLLEGQDRAHR